MDFCLDALEAAIREGFDLSPRGIIAALELRNPIFKATAAYGHFGRKAERRVVDGRPLDFFTWERTDRADARRETANRLAGAAKGAGR